MKKILFILCLISPFQAFSDVPQNQINEVQHLLNFIKNTSCTIRRNGTEHNGKDGVKHIQKKYDYYRNDIKSTEDFIQYSATKSTLSGNHYTVTCPGKKTLETQQWLLNELNQYRKNPSNTNEQSFTSCPKIRPQVCTMEYIPVCAKLNSSDIKTYASACSACADHKVISYKEGSCKNDNNR